MDAPNGLDWSKRLNKKINKKIIIFYSVLSITVATVVGSTLNRIDLHMAINQIKAQGINYDAFRDMKLPVNIISSIKKNSKLLSECKKLKWETIDSLTLSMFLSHYDIKEFIPISKRNTNYLLQNLSYNESFQELRQYYNSILGDIKCFPVKNKANGKSFVTFGDSWNAYRSYGGNRRHEGTDLMPEKNIRGYYSVISMTDGTIEKLGWLEQGGYRIGIRGYAGAYYYYAHLESYAPDLKIGDTIVAGQFLGYMGDSGYGKEGTTGMFDVHLHIGIYVKTAFGELSINPYNILQYLEGE